MKFILLVCLGGYFVLLLGVSFVFTRRLKNLEDFFLASRALPASLVFLSLAASWIGATSLLVSVDEAYYNGVRSFWVMGAPAVLTVLVFAVFLVFPIRQLRIVTLPDLVEMRYGSGVRHMASLLIVWYMVLLAASQMVALGNILKAILGTSYFWGLVLGTGIVLIYSVFGGFFSVAVTDGLQFLLLAVGLGAVVFYLSGNVNFNEIPLLASQLRQDHYFSFFSGFQRNLLIVVSFACAWIVSPIVWQRIQAARSEKDAKQGLLAAAGFFFLIYGGLVFVGIGSLSIFPSGELETPVLAGLMASKGGVYLQVVLFIAIVAAIMSTMDTAINTGALSLTKDVYQRLFPGGGQLNIVFISRLSTVLIAVLSFLIATRMQSILQTLGLASEIITEGLFVPGIFMLFLRKKMPVAGFLSLSLGGLYSIGGFLCEIDFLPLSWPSWPYSVPYGIALSLLGFILGGAIDWVFRSRK